MPDSIVWFMNTHPWWFGALFIAQFVLAIWVASNLDITLWRWWNRDKLEAPAKLKRELEELKKELEAEGPQPGPGNSSRP